MVPRGSPTTFLAILLLLGCGAGGPVGCGTSAPEATPEASGAEDGDPRDLVLVDARTDRERYAEGEAAVLTRTWENRGDRPVLFGGADAAKPAHADPRRVVGLAHRNASRIYEPRLLPAEEAVVPPGERFEDRVEVELPGPGSYVIEVPPEYLVRGTSRPCLRLVVTVTSGMTPEALAAKAERLAGQVEREDPGCPTCWTEAHKDLEALGEAAIPHLRRWLRESRSAHLRAVAARMLGGARTAEAVADLVAGTHDGAAEVRRMCARSLLACRNDEVLDALLPLAGDPDPWVRVEALEAIAGFDDPRVLPALQAALADPDGYVRQRAAVTLAEEKGDPAGARVLIAALEEAPAREAGSVVPALETLTGLSFGEVDLPFVHSTTEAIEASSARNEAVAAKWLAWWRDAGRARFAPR